MGPLDVSKAERATGLRTLPAGVKAAELRAQGVGEELGAGRRHLG